MQITLELLDHLQYRPKMLGVVADSYESVVAYLLGLDRGTDGGALAGIQELVELKFGSPTPTLWPSLLAQIEPPLAESTSDDERLKRLFDLLHEYVAVDRAPGGLKRIFHEWVLMSQEADYYRPDMARYGTSPAPITLSLGDAAAALATDEAGILEMIGDGVLRCGRLGGEVRVISDSLLAVPSR